MATQQIKRKTAKVHQDMEEVIVNTDGALRAVATAVQEVNETLATHAAWTEERFEKVDDRLVTLSLGQAAMRRDVNEISTRLSTTDLRVGVLEVGQLALRKSQDDLHQKVDHLTARVEEFLAIAIRHERRPEAAGQ